MLVILWNSLPETVVPAESVNSFKNRLDAHCRYAKKSGRVDILQCHKIHAQFLPTFSCMPLSKINCVTSMMNFKKINILSDKESNFPLISKEFFKKIVLREEKGEENCLFFTLFLLKIYDSNQAKFFIVQKLHVSTPIM